MTINAAHCFRSSKDIAYDNVRPQQLTWCIMVFWIIVIYNLTLPMFYKILLNTRYSKHIDKLLENTINPTFESKSTLQLLMFIGLLGFLSTFVGIIKDIMREGTQEVYWFLIPKFYVKPQIIQFN